MTMKIGVSDFQKMVIIVCKKQKPKIIYYRNYKTFNANLNIELLTIGNNNAELPQFTNTALSIILDKHASVKRKFIRVNNSAFMTKDLRAAMVKRSKLR